MFFISIEIDLKCPNTSTEAYCIFPIQFGGGRWRHKLVGVVDHRRKMIPPEGWVLLPQINGACYWAPFSAHILSSHWYCSDISLFLLGTFLCWFSARSKAYSLVCALRNSFSRVKVFLRRFLCTSLQPLV